MADGYRYLQHSAGNPPYNQYNPNSAVANEILLNTLLSHVAPEPSSSTTDIPRSSPPRETFGGMYGQNHQQGQHSRLNGAPTGQRMPMLYNNYQQPPAHQLQAHAQHHQPIQPDHTGHGAGGNVSVIGHHSSYSSGVLPNASPFATNLQNGHGSTTRGGQAQQINDHWAEQLRLHKEAERAHSAMIEQHQPNFYARLKADQNKGVAGPAPTTNSQASADNDAEDRRRPTAITKPKQRQEWYNLDLSGQGLRAISSALFSYTFLQELYIASNKLSSLPPAIGELRQLTLLEASYNQISELPPEIGMCTQLKSLFLFENNIRTLPFELGSLSLLEMLGVEGNPLNADLKQEIMERGTKSLISLLREQAPGKILLY